jgi:hypothetical protein
MRGPNRFFFSRRGHEAKGKRTGGWRTAQGRKVSPAGMPGAGEKVFFFHKHSPNCDFYGRSAFLSSCNQTGRSDVRGKVGLKWVRKVQLSSLLIVLI